MERERGKKIATQPHPEQEILKNFIMPKPAPPFFNNIGQTTFTLSWTIQGLKIVNKKIVQKITRKKMTKNKK